MYGRSKIGMPAIGGRCPLFLRFAPERNPSDALRAPAPFAQGSLRAHTVPRLPLTRKVLKLRTSQGLPCVREAVMASGHDGRVVFAPLREISIRAEGTPSLTTGHETLTAGRSSSLPARAVGDRPYGVKRKSVRNSRRGRGLPPYGRCSTVPARADAPARGMPHP